MGLRRNLAHLELVISRGMCKFAQEVKIMGGPDRSGNMLYILIFLLTANSSAHNGRVYALIDLEDVTLL